MGLGSKYLPHHPKELSHLLSLAVEADSILEIGSRYGTVLYLLAGAMRGNKVVSIDLPNAPPWGNDSRADLERYGRDLRKIGFDAKIHIGDSHDDRAIKFAKDNGPYDLVFIDGDHTYEGAKKDWENYGPLGKVVVFHDIIKPGPKERQELGVWRLWEEIKGNKTEFIGEGSKMGLGIVYAEAT